MRFFPRPPFSGPRAPWIEWASHPWSSKGELGRCDSWRDSGICPQKRLEDEKQSKLGPYLFVRRLDSAPGWPAPPWQCSNCPPGRLTCGFDVWVEQSCFYYHNRRLRVKLSFHGNPNPARVVLACMNPNRRYRVRWNGTDATFTTLHGALLQVQLPPKSAPGELHIDPV